MEREGKQHDQIQHETSTAVTNLSPMKSLPLKSA